MGAKTFRRLIYGAGAALLLALLALALRPVPHIVDLAEVTRGDLAATVAEEGETRVREVYTVSAPVAGRLLRVRFDVGDPVTAGETVLARIRPTDPAFLDRRTEAEITAEIEAARASLALAEADVARAEAERDFAASELKRGQELAEKGNISTASLDRARMASHTAEASVRTAKAAVAVARSELSRAQAALAQPGEAEEGAECCIVQLVSPATGRVLRLLQESEAVVIAGQGIIEVGDPRDLEVVADLLSTDAVRVRAGAPVTIEGWGGERLRGRVRRVEPFGFTKVSALGVEEQRVNAIIDFVGPREAWQTLGHGYRVDVAIEVWRGRDVVSVPGPALFREGNDWAVFVARAGRARLRRVEAGRFGPDRVQIVSGLDPGERVVMHPGPSIEDGAPIKPRG
ncbi:HlyD family secretion protein [Rhodothalassium salexigens DSM 2132]|uniref:HlyD family secretion protein n=1 Tax=Rhodothalassium salexigens DSM 2132 TaxID=1188247 RepID=A0A4R2PGC2_RHOSA|nr:HlyD family efflux transporter periplasmic adaptor subunit [Rhodothalassium salexigens]MBB4211668.1 HlyD family secretion protein [Rhodothalassium salexigens DSM 2132]MBK1639297.1 hypothetical protein [Rhodothalassium salexigens DSM 2132]TCP34400.1 HlyD family secretion protein [Rhodothalassium salexigens DSM 2132]